MRTRLVWLDGQLDIDSNTPIVLVGRHGDCDLQLDSARVSLHHCCLVLDAGQAKVRDLSSTNGTRINGRPVKSGRLRPGDILSIADCRFRLALGGSSAESVLLRPLDTTTEQELHRLLGDPKR